MHFTGFTFLVSMFFSAAISSCNKGRVADNSTDSAVAKLDLKNVAYGTDTAQKLDAYLPANRNTDDTKVILFIHGGSWSGGDKNDFNEAINTIRPQLPGYAIFNINYRLANGATHLFPAQIKDIQKALVFIKSKADNFKINASKIALVGASAGAHLSLLEAYKNNKDGQIKAVVDLFGPSDLTDLYNNHPIPAEARWVLKNFLGKTPASDPALYQQSSPINFVSSASVPTLILHGTNDLVVPVSQSTALKAKLLANHVKVEMTAYAGEGHGWYGKNLQETYSKVIKFIKENVQ